MSVRAHPAFNEALLASARVAVDLYSGNRLLNAVASDRGRFLIAILASYLHETRDEADPTSGLTAARLQAVATRTGLCSAGRTRAMIALMRWAGLLSPVQTPDRRMRRLAPTGRLNAIHAERWRRQLAAAALVLPEAAAALERFEHPAFLPAFTRAFGSQYLTGYRILDAAPEFGLFAERNAGLPMLMSLIARGALEHPVEASASALARQFHVSRGQTKDILREVATLGLIERDGEQIDFSPDLKEAANGFFARAFLFLGWCGEQASNATRVPSSYDSARSAA